MSSMNATAIAAAAIASLAPTYSPSAYDDGGTSVASALPLHEEWQPNAGHEEWKNGHDKAITIICGVTAILSTMSSSLLIFIVARSRDRLRTTYHRLVLGMAVSDIVLSACWMTFDAMVPADMGYMIWDARGNQATCDAQGFLFTAGATAGLFYSCALNLNYLAMVKYSCSEAFIRSRLEPFLHFFPIGLALVFGIVPLAGNNYNGSRGACQGAPVYEPDHCAGIEDGQVPEGFDIPCGRGRDGFAMFYSVSFNITLFIPQIIVGVSLSLMYRALRNQENRTARYGAGALNLNAPGADGDAAAHDDGGGGVRGGVGRGIASSVTSLRADLARRFKRRAATNQERPLSHAVVQRAAAYSAAFFLTWSWTILVDISRLAFGQAHLALLYLLVIFNPLQGFFNLLIYMQPRVTSARRFRGRDLSWRQAIARAFRTSLGLEWRGGDVPPAANTRRGGDAGQKTQRAPAVEEERAVPDEESAGGPAPAEEEETDVQESNGYPGEGFGAFMKFLHAPAAAGAGNS